MASLALEQLAFDNTYSRLPEAFYAKLNRSPFSSDPNLVAFSAAAAALIRCRRRSRVE